ncbi:MAG: phosphoglucomutase (alpha-D-glucose-1,6-bisphosphate-dependent) [Proteobacteria bacterium]|nr:phosphoglucomutase (alpha-D-glucose-1,6-bisphosphate-dependent) [Pseudomonadota bacterium]
MNPTRPQTAQPGQPAPASALPDLDALVQAFYARTPDPADPKQRVSFGTSGHRGKSLDGSFNEAHIVAMAQAIVEHRAQAGIHGPLFLGMDTHALSEPAMRAAVEVFAAAGTHLVLQQGGGYTPTPVISHAILCHNRASTKGTADGVVVTPSHNPPTDGGFKYNPPSGGPAPAGTTTAIQNRANELIKNDLRGVSRIPFSRAMALENVHKHDFITPYVSDLKNIIKLDTVRQVSIHIGADPMGGAGVAYWEPIAERYGLNLDVVNPAVDPTFSFMTLDHDLKIRMDCSSPFAMASLVGLKDQFDVAFGNDPDFDRHGIVTRKAGLMNPNHYLSVVAYYLLATRSDWKRDARIGMTLVTSKMLQRVAEGHGRQVAKTPVGFKWFVDGLLDGSFGMGCEESAGASFLRLDGTVWSTDKDGIILNLLAAEMTATTGRDIGDLYDDLTKKYGRPAYQRKDAPIADEQKKAFASLTPASITATDLAGENIESIRTTDPTFEASIGGIYVDAGDCWFAARPSGTEAIYKIYAESFKGPEHLKLVQEQAVTMLETAFAAS